MNKIIYVAAAFLFLAACSQEKETIVKKEPSKPFPYVTSQEFDVGEYVKVEHEMLGLSEPMNGGSVLTVREAREPETRLIAK